MAEDVIDYKEVMARTGLGKTRVYELLDECEVEGCRLGGRKLFFRSSVDAYIERNRIGGSGAPAVAPPPAPARARRRPRRADEGLVFKFL
jgi:excisionase family DNA binding protein